MIIFFSGCFSFPPLEQVRSGVRRLGPRLHDLPPALWDADQRRAVRVGRRGAARRYDAQRSPSLLALGATRPRNDAHVRTAFFMFLLLCITEYFINLILL